MCDLTWFEGISSVVMVHKGSPSFGYLDVYFEVLIDALYSHETSKLRGIPEYNYPELFAKFNKNEWDYYLSHASERTKNKVKYLLGEEETRVFDKNLVYESPPTL